MNKQTFQVSKYLMPGLIGVLTFLAGVLISKASAEPLLSAVAVLFVVIAILVGILGNGQGERGSSPAEEAKRLQVVRERAQAIYEVSSTLGATLDYNRVLDSVLDVGVLGLKDAAPSTHMIGMVMMFQNDALRVISSRRLTRQDEKVIVPGREGILGTAIKRAEPVFGQDARSDAELSYFVAFQDAKSILAIPLRAGFDSYGVLVFGTPEANAFSGEHLELFTAISSQATIAIQNAVLYQNLRAEKERIVEVEEDARKKLARDLHDGPTQSVSAIAMRVNYIRRMLEKKQDGIMEELLKVEEIARQTTKEIRNMLFTLRPLVLETQGLSAALQQFGQKMKETHNLDVVLKTQPGVEDTISQHAQGVLFYIVEEAVGNARKHAQASQIVVRLYNRERYFVVEIQDDGVGFDVAAVNTNYDQRGSLGMVNMRERAALVEGTLKIDSALGKGTKISVLVPTNELGSNNGRSNGTTSPRSTQLASKVGSHPK